MWVGQPQANYYLLLSSKCGLIPIKWALIHSYIYNT